MAEWGGDITWFAVDRDGCVAAFLPTECGAIPERLAVEGLERELHETFAALREVTGEEVDPESELDADDLIPSGVYVYWHEGAWLASPYERYTVPDAPIASAALPPAIVAQMVVFDGRFANHVAVQPIEHWKSRTPVAVWLAAGGNTVRCVVGREATFGAEAETLESEFPGEYRIER